MLYEFPDGVDWRAPTNWWMVLPNNGRSVSVERLLPDYEAAVESSDAELARWASQHLNVEIGLALKSDRWRGADHWLPTKPHPWLSEGGMLLVLVILLSFRRELFLPRDGPFALRAE